jgi:Flp pilus assembly pilin Flp
MIARHSFRRLYAIAKDQSGTSVIEVALVAPVLAVMLIGIADLSRGYSERYTLEVAAHRTLERAGVGSTQTDYSFLAVEAAKAAGVSADKVTLANWLECNGTRMADFDAVCAPTQEISRYVSIQIRNTFQPSFFMTGGPIQIVGDAAVRVQ